jgi:hypothetical protein
MRSVKSTLKILYSNLKISLATITIQWVLKPNCLNQIKIKRHSESKWKQQTATFAKGLIEEYFENDNYVSCNFWTEHFPSINKNICNSNISWWMKQRLCTYPKTFSIKITTVNNHLTPVFLVKHFHKLFTYSPVSFKLPFLKNEKEMFLFSKCLANSQKFKQPFHGSFNKLWLEYWTLSVSVAIFLRIYC